MTNDLSIHVSCGGIHDAKTDCGFNKHGCMEMTVFIEFAGGATGRIEMLKSSAARRTESGVTLREVAEALKSPFAFLFQPYKTGAECGEGFAVDTGSIREPELCDVYMIYRIQVQSVPVMQNALALFMNAFCSSDAYLLVAPNGDKMPSNLSQHFEPLGFKEIRNGVMLCDNNARPDYQYKEIHND